VVHGTAWFLTPWYTVLSPRTRRQLGPVACKAQELAFDILAKPVVQTILRIEDDRTGVVGDKVAICIQPFCARNDILDV